MTSGGDFECLTIVLSRRHDDETPFTSDQHHVCVKALYTKPSAMLPMTFPLLLHHYSLPLSPLLSQLHPLPPLGLGPLVPGSPNPLPCPDPNSIKLI
jgi:hypothetical protein